MQTIHIRPNIRRKRRMLNTSNFGRRPAKGQSPEPSTTRNYFTNQRMHEIMRMGR